MIWVAFGVLVVALLGTLAHARRRPRRPSLSPARGLNALADLSGQPAASPCDAPPLAPTGDVTVVMGDDAMPAALHQQWACRLEGPTVEHLEAPAAAQTPLRGATGKRWFRAA